MVVEEKISEWIKLYLNHIKEVTPDDHVAEEEGYKFRAVSAFQENFDIAATDLASMLDRAIQNNNLVTGSWYFPRKMILIFAKENPEVVRSLLKRLFDESSPVTERLNSVIDGFNKLMESRNSRLRETSHHFIGLRFLSLLLGYRFPHAHDALKPREWKVFCKFVDPDFSISSGTSDGEKYEVYRRCIEALRQKIIDVVEIDNLRKKLVSGLSFDDSNFHWMTQDMIYIVASDIIRGRLTDVSVDELDDTTAFKDEEENERVPATIGERFSYEEDLESYICDNFEKIQPAGAAHIFADKDGVNGRQYPVEGGFIDILALDTSGDYVVIELKRDMVSERVLGQLAKYMLWVEENIAVPEGKKVRGVVIAHRSARSLDAAVKALRFPVDIIHYEVLLSLKVANR